MKFHYLSDDSKNLISKIDKKILKIFVKLIF